MSTYEELQDQTCADGIDVMDYEFNSLSRISTLWQEVDGKQIPF